MNITRRKCLALIGAAPVVGALAAGAVLLAPRRSINMGFRGRIVRTDGTPLARPIIRINRLTRFREAIGLND